MIGQILIADKIKFSEESKTYSIENIINKYIIDTLPMVCFFNIFVKISEIPRDEPIEVQILVTNSNGDLVGNSEKILISNPRGVDQVPGVDISISLTLILLKEDNYFFSLYIDGSNQSNYPLKIYKKY